MITDDPGSRSCSLQVVLAIDMLGSNDIAGLLFRKRMVARDRQIRRLEAGTGDAYIVQTARSSPERAQCLAEHLTGIADRPDWNQSAAVFLPPVHFRGVLPRK